MLTRNDSQTFRVDLSSLEDSDDFVINAALDGTGCTAADLNVFAGQSVSPDDFGFDLSLLNSGPNGVAIDPQTGLPIATWRSEGSYSGSATFVPTPGAAALAGLGLVTVSRRRRSK